jgi:hypothetical protein
MSHGSIAALSSFAPRTRTVTLLWSVAWSAARRHTPQGKGGGPGRPPVDQADVRLRHVIFLFAVPPSGLPDPGSAKSLAELRRRLAAQGSPLLQGEMTD